MGKSNIVTYKKTDLDIQKAMNMEEYLLTKKLSEEIEGVYVSMIENIKGYDKKIVFDGEKTYLIKTGDNLKDETNLRIFNKKYLKNFTKLIKRFESIPFSVWAKVIDNEYIFYDMKINDNWVYRNTIEEEFTNLNMKVMPLVYEGVYEESIVKERLNVQSLYNKEKVKSLFIRSTIEGEVDKKRINFYTNENSFVEIITKKEQKEVKEKVEEFIKSQLEFTPYTTKTNWIEFLKDSNMTITSKKSDIYKIIVYKCLLEWTHELRALSRNHKLPLITATQNNKQSEDLRNTQSNMSIGDSYLKVRYSDFIFMCRMDSTKTPFDSDVQRDCFSTNHFTGQDQITPSILKIQDKINQDLITVEKNLSPPKNDFELTSSDE
jgi:hypothetical protein